jgi:hypothetical protein
LRRGGALLIHPGGAGREFGRGGGTVDACGMATRRCACGRRFRPAATAARYQKVCCPECRLKRRRRQAKRRRQADLEGHRADDAERQRRHRARAKEARLGAAVAPRAAATAPTASLELGDGGPRLGCGGGCHGPASDGKCSELQGRIGEIVADAVRRSRTGFEQELRRMLRKIRPLVQSEVAGGGA